jgi:hypothetical protein
MKPGASTNLFIISGWPSDVSGKIPFAPYVEEKADMTQKVVFQIEVEGANTWDFGPVTFTNIEIDAETTDSSWCDLEL